jgi:hypothetical protein
VDSGPHVVAHLAARRAALAGDVGEGEDEGPRRRVGLREVSGVVLADRTTPAQRGAHRQHRVRGVAGEDVGAAGAVGVAGMVGDDRRAALLLPPAEGGHVLVVAVQETGLAGAGLGGPVGFPLPQLVRAAADPGGQVGSAAVLQRPHQDVVGESVDLEEEHPGDVGLGHMAAAACRAGDDVALPGVVLVDRQQRVDGCGDRREDDRDHDPVQHLGDFGAGQEVDREGDQEAVEDERGDPQRQHRQRQGEPGEQRPDEGVEEADQGRGPEGGGGTVEDEPVHHLGEQQEDAGVEQEDEDAAPDRRQAHVGCASTAISPSRAASTTRAKSVSFWSA